MRSRIRLTRGELELVNAMAAIASAQQWGAGDYQSWDDKTAEIYDSLCRKIGELLERREVQDAARREQ